MNKLEKFFTTSSFSFFQYEKNEGLIKLIKREDNCEDTRIFDELKLIVDELMQQPVDFNIQDNGDIKIEHLEVEG